ncbi:TonB-dependent receptor [Flavobacteriaceae bacterium]|nr:TonB-dependent receptor [Flavobacteriaceae bacterium]
MKTYLCGFIALLTMLLSNSFIYSQENISGQVTSEDGPLPGATIIIKGTNNGTTSDFDGNFNLKVTDGDVLVVSYVGFTTQEIRVEDQDSITIFLESGNQLEEVIVTTGYGTQSKREITGAVTTVDAEDLLSVPATTFSQQLQGRASGISIINDATPGGEATVRIRGFGTIGDNNPLYIIDGVPSETQGNLNPNDIESLQILKDASAASIYGSRAANGVIIITTKKGKIGPVKIEYSTYYGTQTVAKDVEALNSRELGEYLYYADLYAGKSPSHGQYTFGGTPESPTIKIPNYVFPSGADSADESTYSLTPDNINAITRSADTNWWKEVTRVAPMMNHQLTATGAAESARYAFTLGYYTHDAVTRFVGYDRISIRMNTEFKTLNDKLTVGENFTVSLDNRKGVFINDEEQNAVSGSYKHHPLLPVYDIAGNFAGSRGANLGNNYSPYASLHRNQDDRRYRIRAFGNSYISYSILDNLSIKSSFGLDLNSERVRDIGRPQPEYVEGNFINSSRSENSYTYQWVLTNTLSYNKVFNDVHKLNAYVGVEAIEQFGELFNASRQKFAFETNEIISYLDLGDATTASNEGKVTSDYALFSQFGKFNYGYGDRFLAQLIIRNDASSRFKAASRNALFPSFSLGWRISEEAFFSKVDFVDDLKFRYGWGQTGNQKIGDYNAFTTYRSNIFNSGYPIDGSSGSPTIGFDAAAFGNPDAKWETTTSSNFGFDALLFDRKLSLEFDLWNRKTNDLLLEVPITFSAGDAKAPSVNIGEMTNKGVDISATFRNSKEDFGYSITANLSTYKNNVDNLDEAGTPIFGKSSRVPSVTITQVGSPISMFYGFKTAGIFQSQQEADNWPKYGEYNAPGKFKIVDVNNDGKINDDDRTEIGNPHPDFVFGTNLNLSYKNLNLNIFGNGSVGNDLFNYVRFFADFNSFQGNRSKRALYDAWQPSNPSAPKNQWVAKNPNATSPIMDANDQVSSRTSTYLIEDGSYFRIKNIQLTYNFGETVKSVLGLSGGQIYVQGQNLITITNYSGLNPEIQTSKDKTLGFDGGYMPVSKTFIIGMNLNLF